METPEVEETSEPLNYKTHVLKVSIHCEACKKKVKKVLQQVQGIHTADIDTKQQKVTVTGKVDADTLVKKLRKSGKHAELWPEKIDQKEKKSGKAKNKEKPNDQKSINEENGRSGCDKAVKKESTKNSEGGCSDDPAKNSEVGGGTSAKISTVGDGGGLGQLVKESKPEEKKTETGSASNQSSSAANKKGGEDDGNGTEKSETAAVGDGNGKKKKGQNGNNAEREQSSGAGTRPSNTRSPNHTVVDPPPVPIPANHDRPRQHGYQYPPQYYATPPVYVTSYNTAYPSSSNTTSYYPSPSPYSYSYSYHDPMMERQVPPSDLDTQPLDSFEMFSDENPNGCTIM